MKKALLAVLAIVSITEIACARDVMLIGDSIRLGYGPEVKKILEARGDRVFQPDDNCRYTLYTLRSLKWWVEKIPDPSAVEVVHWNNGLWDIGELLPGDCTTPVDVYARFLVRIVQHLQHYFPNAKIVFATTTPVNEKVPNDYHTLGDSKVIEYNSAAIKALAGKAVINDLYGFVRRTGLEREFVDVVHYTPVGSRRQASTRCCSARIWAADRSRLRTPSASGSSSSSKGAWSLELRA